MGAGDWSLKLAGGLVVLLGLLNVVLGMLSLTTDLVRLSAGAASGLVVAGAVTIAAGVLVWRGSRLATYVTLTVFALLLVAQLATPLDTTSLPDGDPSASPVVRFGALGLLVAVLALAAWRLRRRRAA